MKLVMIIHSLGIGGMERVMTILLHHFDKYEELELHLLLIGRKREVLQTIPNRTFIHKPNWPFDNSWRTWNTLKTLTFIRKKIKKIHPDTILSFGEMWNNLVLLSLIGLPYPVYISDRSKPEKDLGRLQNWLRGKLYPKAAGYIAQTKQAKKAAIKNKWNGNIRIIGNPIPQISCLDKPKEKIILSVGRLIPTKHFDRLVHIFHQCQVKDWKLVIVGGDAKQMQLSKQLKRQVQQLQMKNQIILTGAQHNVVSLYCRSAIFAFMSTSEGFPNVLGEAMAAGCACIAYDCMAGPADLIDHNKNGFLISEGDEKKFKDNLQLLIDNKDIQNRFSIAAQQKTLKFKPEIVAQKYFQFIIPNQ
ncbi:MAG: glycosyltransferase [Phaeodactylibacter sp.]|uniref:glycosyltransferase n=1 Tax=Phaeodactylibacter sp. TaxID=1940289 RepID=UPI0032ECDBED